MKIFPNIRKILAMSIIYCMLLLFCQYKMKYVKFCFEQVYEASEAVTKIALVESTFN